MSSLPVKFRMEIQDLLARTRTVLNIISLPCRHIILKLFAATSQSTLSLTVREQLGQTMYSSKNDMLLPKNVNFSIFSTTVIGKRISKDKARQLVERV